MSANVIEAVAYQVVIVEDILETAEHLRNFLKKNMVSFLPYQECELVEFVLISEIEEIDEKVFHLNSEKRLFIIDINLGARRETEGLEFIELLHKKKNLNAAKIVYSANTDIISNDLKSKVDKIIKKSNYRENYNEILKALENYFTGQPIVQIDDEIGQNNSDSENNPPMNPLLQIPRFQTHTLSILKNNKPYDELNFIQKRFICQNLLQRPSLELTSVLLDDLDWDLFTDDTESEELSGHIIQHWQVDTDMLEVITLEDIGDTSEQFAFKNIEAIESFLQQKKTKKSFSTTILGRDLVQYFIAQRLAQFYYNEENQDVPRLLQSLNKLHPKIGIPFFVTKIWEWTTLKDTEDIKTTNQNLQSLYEYCPFEIQNIVYGKVEFSDQEEGIVEATLSSISDIHNYFSRELNYDLLAKSEVTQKGAYFKLIIYFPEENQTTFTNQNLIVEPMSIVEYDEIIGI